MSIPKRGNGGPVPPTDIEKFSEWVKGLPYQFPEIFDPESLHLNPFIQDQQEYTYKEVRNGLKFLEEAALPWSNTDSFSLGDEATWGYIRVLQCLSGAMEFEAKRRSDGGFEENENEEND